MSFYCTCTEIAFYLIILPHGGYFIVATVPAFNAIFHKSRNAGAIAKMPKRPIPGLLKPINFVFLVFLFTLQVHHVAALETTLANGDNLSLFGISIHQEQRNDIYVGALFAPENTENTDQILDLSTSKRMSLKFISTYSNRKMARLWKQRIAMNNPKSDWRPMTKEIVQFAGIFKRAMQAGDELNIDFEPISGTSVYLNRTLFLTIPNLDFYKLLLNVWVGSIPPTKAFKAGITGNNKGPLNEQLITHFESIQPQIGRFDDDKLVTTQVAKATPPKPSDQTIPKKTSKSKKVAIQVSPPPPSKKTKPVVKKNTKPTISANTQTETDKVVDLLRNDLEAPRTEIERVKPKLQLDELFKTDLGSGNKQQSVIQAKVNKQNSKQSQSASKQNTPVAADEKIAKLDIPEEELFDSDLFSGSYTRELINSIRAVQKYPKKALIAGVEGEVTVLVKIDGKGEILDNKIIQRSGSRILDRAVLKMVRKAEPFPQIPQELQMNEFEFEVPLSFTLTE